MSVALSKRVHRAGSSGQCDYRAFTGLCCRCLIAYDLPKPLITVFGRMRAFQYPRAPRQPVDFDTGFFVALSPSLERYRLNLIPTWAEHHRDKCQRDNCRQKHNARKLFHHILFQLVFRPCSLFPAGRLRFDVTLQPILKPKPQDQPNSPCNRYPDQQECH